jgi:NDP-sugar pyrophosphorylase family protein
MEKAMPKNPISKMNKSPIALVYLAGGISSRFGGKMKQFAKVGPKGQTLLEYSLSQALPAGFTKIFFIVGEKTLVPMKKKFGNRFLGVPVSYILQKYDPKNRIKPFGTADALICAKDALDCPFVLCNSDDIYGSKSFKILCDHLKSERSMATVGYPLLKVLPKSGKVNRGIILSRNGYVSIINEVLAVSKKNYLKFNLDKCSVCNMNIFAIRPSIFKLLAPLVADFKKKNINLNSECILSQEFSKLIIKNKIKMKLYTTSDNWFGITNPEDEAIVRNQISNLKC